MFDYELNLSLYIVNIIIVMILLYYLVHESFHVLTFSIFIDIMAGDQTNK